MKTRFLRMMALTAVLCLSLMGLCACGDGGEYVPPEVSGEALTGWPSDAVFGAVPQFADGTFDEAQSVLKAGNSLLFFQGVEPESYDTYYQALVNAGFTDAMAGAGGTTVKNARFTDEDGTVMVSLNYRSASKQFKITLVEVVEAEEEEE